MRLVAVCLLILVLSKATSQVMAVFDTSATGVVRKTYVNMKPVSEIPDSVTIMIAPHFRIKIPKTILQGIVDWANILSKPSTFTPSTHTHPQSDITNLTSDLAGKAASSHGHAIGDVTNLQTSLNGRVNVSDSAAMLTPYLRTNIAAATYQAKPVYANVSGSNFTTTGQSLVDITGLSIPLTTNAVYELEAWLSVSTSAVTTGTQYGVNYSVAGGSIEGLITGSSTSSATKTERISALNTATTAYLTTSAQSGGMFIKARVSTGANAGNLTIKTLKVTSGTSTVFTNSTMKVTRIQ